MTILTNTSLWNWKRNNGFWAEAAINAEKLTNEELDQVEDLLNEIYKHGIDQTDLNDLFRFQFEWICASIGISSSEFCRRMNWDYNDLDQNLW